MPAIALTLIAATYLFACLWFLAPKKPGYSHFKHTISEIGEVGAPNQRFVAYGLFLPVGLLLLAAAFLVRETSASSAGLALAIAVGYLVAAIFPCDAGSPLSGTARQAMHNLGGAVEYVGGGFALMSISQIMEQPFKTMGFIVLGSTVALSVLPSTSVRGLIQRIAESCLFGGLAMSIYITGVSS